jgi:ribose transport system substrate-binding protein
MRDGLLAGSSQNGSGRKEVRAAPRVSEDREGPARDHWREPAHAWRRVFVKDTGIVRRLATMAAVVALAAACSNNAGATAGPTTAAPSTGGAATTAPTTAAKQYVIGFSNTGGTGNGFREEQNCTAKAEALASGQVSKVVMIAHNTDANGQLSDLRDLISQGVDAIVFNPSSPDALNPALAEAKAAGIKTVAVDAYVTDPDTWNFYNNQVDYAYLGASWLFKYLEDNGKANGTIWYTRGIAGHPADTDRHTGFMKALGEHPGFKVLPSNEGVFTGWDPAEATKLANDFINSGDWDKIDGVWTSGMDSQVVDAIKAANKPYVPIVGADLGAFVGQLLNTADYPGLEGVAVTNTAAVGGAGINLALKLLNGETVTTDPSASQPNTVLLKPVGADNTSDAGKAMLQSWQVDGLDPLWPLGLQIDGYTTYTPEQAVACKGPGE